MAKKVAFSIVFMYSARMQLITNLTKHFVFAVLSISLLIAWNSGNIMDVTNDNSMTAYMIPARNTSPKQEHKVTVVTGIKNPESIWSNMRREFKLDHKAQSSRVKTEIRKLLADQDKLYSILKAAAPYIYFIHQQTQTRGLPAELALIPVIESEFNPNDRSNKGATGLWQLMAGTAHELGIRIRSGYDGRRNVIASTRAALAYFNDLGNAFNGNWYLAIAAYNCGEMRIRSALRRAGSKNFWNLSLPRETTYYVPKLLAVAEIVNNPDKYGVKLPNIHNKPFFSEVPVKKQINLDRMAKSLKMDVTVLRKLNPDYKSGVINKKLSSTFLVPVENVQAVKTQLGIS